MNNRAVQQGQSTDSCLEIKTTQKLYIKQKLKSRIISAITQTQDIPRKSIVLMQRLNLGRDEKSVW